VWLFALALCFGLAALSGQTGGGPSPRARAAAASATARSPIRIIAAPMSFTPQEGGDQDLGPCEQTGEAQDYLPIHRWTSFPMSVVDNTVLLKPQMYISEIAELLFMTASLIWQLIALLMGFSFTFDAFCHAATPINDASGLIAQYAAWFLIPAWLCVLAVAMKRWNGGEGKGPASAIRLVVTFFVASGMVFFLADQSAKHPKDPLAAYTAPWMARQVQSGFSMASSSLLQLGDLRSVAQSQAGDPFYDDDSEYAGAATCAELNAQLYKEYENANKGSGLGDDGVGAMEQISKIWESSFVRSWETAQFGTGTRKYPSPAHAACRMLEGVSSVDPKTKWKVYDESAGFSPGTTDNTYRGFWISPPGGYQNDEVIAWSACQQKAKGSAEGDVIPEWKSVKFYGQDGAGPNGGNLTLKDTCNQKLLSSDKTFDVTNTAPTDDDGPLQSFHFGGGDQVTGQIVPCMKKDEGCRAAYDFVNSWLGANGSTRITQGLMSLIIAVVFLIVLGPMAIGLMFVSIALALLVMIVGFSLLLFAIGNENGKRLLKLTGAAAAGKFIFTLALTFLMMFIAVSYVAIDGVVDTTTPNLAQQALQAAAPLVAMLAAKKALQAAGFGDIGKFTGALGFASTAALKATGDPRLSHNAAQRVSGAIGDIGVGDKRLSSLDERSLQRRMVDNRATRAAAKGAGRLAAAGVRRGAGVLKDDAATLGRHALALGHSARVLAAPVTGTIRRVYEASPIPGGLRAVEKSAQAIGKTAHNAYDWAMSSSPAVRALGYGALTAGLVGLTVAAPAAAIATIPAIAHTGLRFADRTALAATDGLNRLSGVQQRTGGVLQAAREEISDFPRTRVERPGGTAATVAEVKVELDGKVDGMQAVLGQMKQLQQSSGSMDPEHFQARFAELTQKSDGYAADISALSRVVEDAIRSADSARALTELHIELNREGAQVDPEDLRRRFQTERQDQHAALHEEYEGCRTGIGRRPVDAEAIDDVMAALQHVLALTSTGIDTTQRSNRVVMKRFEQLEKEQEERHRLLESQPRQDTARTGKEMVKAHSSPTAATDTE
jgi:hypothetical protein